MITISTSSAPTTLAEVSGGYQKNSIEYKTVTMMWNSREHYYFESMKELAFELSLRKEIVSAAIDLNHSAFAFAIFHYSRCNEVYWERTANGGFELKKTVKPSEGIEDIYRQGSLYATECATAMLVVYYKAVLKMVGEQRFDQMFSQIYLMNWHIRQPLLEEIGVPVPVTDFLYGDRAYFNNPDVDPVTPQWQGENVIILDDDQYYGHGVGINTAGHIIHTLNKFRKPQATQSAYLMDSVSRPNFRKLYKTINNLSSQDETG